MPKRSLRSRILAERRALSHDSWFASSCAAQANLIGLDEYAGAACIALYAPTHNETDTALILADAFKAGKRILYPAVCGQQMVLRHVESVESLQAGAFGIMEPCSTAIEHRADEVDLIVVPGVAFDLFGHRIGYGKGFYDRFLHGTHRPARLVGLCYDFQVTESAIPADPHDIPMEMVVTDKRIIRITG